VAKDVKKLKGVTGFLAPTNSVPRQIVDGIAADGWLTGPPSNWQLPLPCGTPRLVIIVSAGASGSRFDQSQGSDGRRSMPP
jgi:hypothetical protein